MSTWRNFTQWVSTGEGIAAVIGSVIALLVAVGKFGKASVGVVRKMGQAVRFFLNIEEHHGEIVGRLDSLDRGQLDIIQTRGHIMDADERAAFFKCDAQGHCIWVSELWREWTGLSTEAAMGDGWELGIHESDRARVWQNWQTAVARKHRYEDVVTYCNRSTGKITKAKVIGNPVRDNEGNVLSYNGQSKPLPQ